MKILALDLARKFGWCRGEAGSIPESGSETLRAPGEPNGLALGALARWLEDSVLVCKAPDLLVIEHWLPPFGQKGAAVVEDSLRMNGACHAIAGLHGLTVLEPYPATVRALVCGRATMPGETLRDGRKLSNTKWMVIETMILRGYLPARCTDDNRADACALWCWAEAVHGRTLALTP